MVVVLRPSTLGSDIIIYVLYVSNKSSRLVNPKKQMHTSGIRGKTGLDAAIRDW